MKREVAICPHAKHTEYYGTEYIPPDIFLCYWFTHTTTVLLLWKKSTSLFGFVGWGEFEECGPIDFADYNDSGNREERGE